MPWAEPTDDKGTPSGPGRATVSWEPGYSIGLEGGNSLSYQNDLTCSSPDKQREGFRQGLGRTLGLTVFIAPGVEQSYSNGFVFGKKPDDARRELTLLKQRLQGKFGIVDSKFEMRT